MSPHTWIARALIVMTAAAAIGVSAEERGPTASEHSAADAVRTLNVTILSTMLTDSRGIGEWGFSALVEADGYRVLYDTGYRSGTVLQNAKELGVDLGAVRDVVLSHNHGDHTGGLLTLRRSFGARVPEALSRLHVGRGLFDPREFPPRLASMGFHFPPMQEVRAEYAALGGQVVEHDAPVRLSPGVWLTGPVPRVHPEKNWGPAVKVMRDGAWQEDTLFEDAALLIHTKEGLVVITGCGHAGIINILDYAQSIVPGTSVHAVIGGLHLFSASDDILRWTADELARHRVAHLVGAHCTGIHATHLLAERLGLPRERAAVGAVGASFSLQGGIDALPLAR